VVMYMREARAEVSGPLPVPFALAVAMLISAAATLWLGILPGQVLDYARRSALDLLQ
jgi:NADH:ubiquinone oxidoreductase subunit 2 (subunit N)